MAVRPLIRYVFLLYFTVFVAAASASDPIAKEAAVPEDANPGLDYLLELAQADHSQPFDLSKIESVIHFLRMTKDQNTLYFPGNRKNVASAYYEFDIHKNLKHILDIGFNPNIPPFIISPSSIRLAYWTEINGKHQSPPDLSAMLSRLDKPVTVSGVEHEEITPDLNTGAYYGYDLNRTLILMKYQGRPVLISISKQKNVSDVGKKGLVLGKDSNWDYFYSGLNGLNKPGLGWVNSYMYDSCTVSIFMEEDDAGASKVHCGIFKWLRAGWADINMVQNHHIYGGLKRYTDTVKGVLEYPSLPEPKAMAEIFSRINTFSSDELREKVRSYMTRLSQKYQNDAGSDGKLIAESLQDDTYLNHLNKYQMRSILAVEYIKFLLGKNSVQDIAYIFNPADIVSQQKG